MQAGTIVASNYLAMAHVLGESFLEHHPESTFSVLVVDDGPADLPDPIQVVRLGDLDLPGADERLMRTVYDVMEFSTAVKPSFLRYLVSAGGGQAAACYLDPDIQVFAPFDDHVDAALEHGIVLTPHVLAPVPRDGMRVDEETIMQSGMYNCGFLAVGATAGAFLDWWDERLRFDALVDFGRARFTDQRWVDWVPSLFDFTIDRDPGMNVAWWNIHDRPIDVAASGATVDGGPLRFVHFSGYDPQQPDLLSKHQLPRPRTEHAPGTGIRALADAYGARLVELGHVERRRGAYPWNRSHDDVELTTELRRMVRDAALAEIERSGEVTSVPDAFDPDVDFAGWVEAHTGASVQRTAVDDVAMPRGASVEITRTAPKQEASALHSVSDSERNTYDVEFDWNDAHGHAVRLLLDHVEPGVVVDLGCGYAPHAEVLQEAGFEFIGLELDEASLADLDARGIVARQADLSRPTEIESILAGALSEVASDAGVVAVMVLDVLEHLVEPEQLLGTMSAWMRQHDDSLLVTSVPNVAHRDIAAKLLAGRWDVTPTGLLDHTHLRFFTDASLTAVMASAGFAEATRNDRVAPRSDQRWPDGLAFTSPDTPLASVVAAVRDVADDHGDTYQLIRGYRATAEVAGVLPSLLVADPASPTVGLTVIADPSMNDDQVAQLRTQLQDQTSTDWELLVRDGQADGADDREASYEQLLAAASGTYVAVVERGEQLETRWVEQFVAAMRVTVAGGAPNGDVSGRLIRCEVSGVESASVAGSNSATLAFPTASLRALRPSLDGSAHLAVRLWAQLAPFCGEIDTGIPAVQPAADGAAVGMPSARAAALPAAGEALRTLTELPATVESLRSEIERLRAENERLARDNEWLNAELSPAPIRVVRRVLGRDASLD